MAIVTGDASISGAGSASLSVYSDWSDRPFLMLNGFDVTDHGRQTSFTVKQMGVKSVQSASGFKRNYFPSNTTKVSMSSNWKMMPDSSSFTTDGRSGRKDMKALASSRSAIVLYVKKPDGSGYAVYNTFVNKYDEKLVMRRNFDGGVLYDISMEFTEL
jgi:hypothetical protein